MTDVGVHGGGPHNRPALSAPTQWVRCGCGLRLIGRAPLLGDEGWVRRARALCVLFVPIWWVDAWRYPAAGGDGPAARTGLAPVHYLSNALLTAIALGILCWGWLGFTDSAYYRERQEYLEASRGFESATPAERIVAVQSMLRIAGAKGIYAPEAAERLSTLAAGNALNIPAPCRNGLVWILARLPDDQRRSGSRVAEVDALAERLALAAPHLIEAFGIIEVAAPVMDEGRQEAIRVHWLEDGAARDPKDFHIASELAVRAERAGDLKRCRALLEPLAVENLKPYQSYGGDAREEARRILGMAYMAEGLEAEACRILGDEAWHRSRSLFTLRVMPTSFHPVATRMASWRSATSSGQAGRPDSEVRTARSSATRPAAVASPGWVFEDPAVRRRRDIDRHARVIFEIAGIGLRVQRAQILTGRPTTWNGTQITAALEALKPLIEDRDDLQVSMAEIELGLGQAAPARARLGAVLQRGQRMSDCLAKVADALHRAGDREGSLLLVEEAYRSATSAEEKQIIVSQGYDRADSRTERRNWLGRCEASAPWRAAAMAEEEAAAYLEAGNEERAISAQRAGLAAWQGMPPTVRNRSRAAYASLARYQLDGDPGALRSAVQLAEEARRLDAGDPIAASAFAAARRMEIAAGIMADACGGIMAGVAIRPADLRHLAGEERTHQALLSRMSSTGGDMMLLARESACRQPCSRRAVAELVQQSVLQGDARALAGAYDLMWPQGREEIDLLPPGPAGRSAGSATAARAAARRALEAVVRARAEGGRTLAVAIGILLDRRAAVVRLGGATDAEEDAAFAEEAVRAFAGPAAEALLIRALVDRAALRLAADEPRLARLVGTTGSELSPGEVLLASVRSGGWRKSLAADADMRRAGDLAAQRLESAGKAIDVWDWALLAALGRPEAAAAGRMIRTDPVLGLRCVLDRRLEVGATMPVVRSILYARAHGEVSRAIELAEEARAARIAIPEEL